MYIYIYIFIYIYIYTHSYSNISKPPVFVKVLWFRTTPPKFTFGVFFPFIFTLVLYIFLYVNYPVFPQC